MLRLGNSHGLRPVSGYFDGVQLAPARPARSRGPRRVGPARAFLRGRRRGIDVTQAVLPVRTALGAEAASSAKRSGAPRLAVGAAGRRVLPGRTARERVPLSELADRRRVAGERHPRVGAAAHAARALVDGAGHRLAGARRCHVPRGSGVALGMADREPGGVHCDDCGAAPARPRTSASLRKPTTGVRVHGHRVPDVGVVRVHDTGIRSVAVWIRRHVQSARGAAARHALERDGDVRDRPRRSPLGAARGSAPERAHATSSPRGGAHHDLAARRGRHRVSDRARDRALPHPAPLDLSAPGVRCRQVRAGWARPHRCSALRPSPRGGPPSNSGRSC